MSTRTAWQPAARALDIVTINGQRARIEYVGITTPDVYVVTPEGDRFSLWLSEITLVTEEWGQPSVWHCWTDANGRRA